MILLNEHMNNYQNKHMFGNAYLYYFVNMHYAQI